MAQNDGISSTISGLPDLKAALAGIVPKLRVRALRNALAKGARLVQKEARRLTPVLSLLKSSNRYAFRKGYRKPGTVQKAISVRTSKLAKRRGDVGVFVNVRPAKSGARGAKSYKDPFYFRWLDWGWNPAGRDRSAAGKKARRQLNQVRAVKKRPGARFTEGAAKKLGDALQVFIKAIGPAIEKLNRPKAPAP